MNRQSILTRGAGVIISTAVILAIAAVALAALFNPVWIGPAQERSGVPSITGWSTAQVERITGSVVGDVLLGPPQFDVSAPGGEAVLGDAERGHMRDVYTVLRAFALVLLLVGGAGALLLWRHRSVAAAWRAVARGAGLLALAGIVMAVLVFLWYWTTDDVAPQVAFVTPYVATLLVLSLASQRLRMPAADGKPYLKGEEH